MQANFGVEVPEGAVNLSGYPNLVYAPDQWGDRVVVIGSHRPAGDLFRRRLEGATVDELAAEFGCSIRAVGDALHYAEAHPDC